MSNFIDSKLNITNKTSLEKLINYIPNDLNNDFNFENNSDYDEYLSSSHSSCHSNFEQIDIPKSHSHNKLYNKLDDLIYSGRNGLIINDKIPKILEIQPRMGKVIIDDLVKFAEISNGD